MPQVNELSWHLNLYKISLIIFMMILFFNYLNFSFFLSSMKMDFKSFNFML